ncbi:MAG: sugar transferase [Candidatus Sericytochromatia bacterium]|nr:sugar transferase [Candidatus Sericytochromatia bacterium]
MQAILTALRSRTTLGPLGETQPAALLPLLGRPLLLGTARWLAASGCGRIDVVLRERPAALAEHLDEATRRLGLRMHLENGRTGNDPGWRRQLGEPASDVLLCPGSLVSQARLDALHDLHQQTGSALTVGLRAPEVSGLSGRWCLDASGRLRETPDARADGLALAGLFLCRADGLTELLADGWEPDEDSLRRAIARGLPVHGVRLDGWLADAREPGGYMAALQAALAGNLVHHQPLAEARTPGIWIAPGARVHPSARLQAPCFIGPGVQVEADAVIGPGTSLEAGCRVERGAELRDTSVFPHTRVGLGTRWEQRWLFPHGELEWQTTPVRARASDDERVLGASWQTPWGERWHGWLDQALAAGLIVASAPLWLLIILAIKLDSPGPAFFTQLRTGQDRRPYRPGQRQGEVFTCFKFRTMRLDAEQQVAALRARNQYRGGTFFKLEQDPRITRVGHFLRRTSLDELPQLLNVLWGDMRLVGNRPLPLYEAAALQEDWQRTRFLAPAGITGLWQISGRSDLSEKERLALDAYYSVTRNFRGDWAILLRTIPALLRRRGAR